jgi:hypothetical protein
VTWSAQEEEKNVDDATEEEQKLRRLRRDVDSQKSYPTIKWTLNQLLLHERLSAVPVEEWSHETIGDAINSAVSVADPSLPSRATEFVLAVRRGVAVEEALPIPPGSKLLSADRLLKLQLHCEKIRLELAAVQRYMLAVLQLVAEKEGLDADTDPTKEVVICPAGIDGVWISDNGIPDQVAAKFKGEVAVLEAVPDEEKDWHPHSKQQVLDLVHPSLFCSVSRLTLRASSALDPSSYSTPLEQMQRLMFTGTETMEIERPRWRPNYSSYQWIPTDFLLGAGGEPGRDAETVRCLSYINNLHPAQHGDLYDSISVILGRFVPLFERMLSDRAAGFCPSAFDVNMFDHSSFCDLPRRPRVPDEAALPTAPVTVSLRGKTVQVIVKIAEILLTPDNPRYTGGVWHIEGTPAEKIVGTGLYYFACENIKDSRLTFRTEIEEPEYDQNDSAGVAEIYGLFAQKLLVQVLGSVESLASRCVVFPNNLQHQVQPFELADPSKAGVRKILAFFLVDPEAAIPSTSVIPPQQQEWLEPAIERVSEQLGLAESVGRNIRSMLPRGMSLTEAKQHRLYLMKERAATEDNDVDAHGNSRLFSLCEH